jgi:hypothetical protein
MPSSIESPCYRLPRGLRLKSLFRSLCRAASPLSQRRSLRNRWKCEGFIRMSPSNISLHSCWCVANLHTCSTLQRKAGRRGCQAGPRKASCYERNYQLFDVVCRSVHHVRVGRAAALQPVARAQATDRRLRISKDVPVLRVDYSPVQEQMPGVRQAVRRPGVAGFAKKE